MGTCLFACLYLYKEILLFSRKRNNFVSLMVKKKSLLFVRTDFDIWKFVQTSRRSAAVESKRYVYRTKADDGIAECLTFFRNKYNHTRVINVQKVTCYFIWTKIGIICWKNRHCADTTYIFDNRERHACK